MPKVIENPEETIIEKAKEILINHDYEEFNIRAVAKACGLAVGTIYNYFPTKKALVARVIVEHWEGYFVMIEEIDRREVDLFSKLAKMYQQLEQFVHKFRSIWVKINFDVKQFASAEKMQKHINYIDRLTKIMEGVLTRAVASDDKIHLPLDTHDFAEFIVQNFLIMSQMGKFEYSTFEEILQKLLKD